EEEKSCECWDSPLCPSCKDDFNVVCYECGQPWLQCTCRTDECNFFCQVCQREFIWEPTFYGESAEEESLDYEIVDDILVPIASQDADPNKPAPIITDAGALVWEDGKWYWPDGNE